MLLSDLYDPEIPLCSLWMPAVSAEQGDAELALPWWASLFPYQPPPPPVQHNPGLLTRGASRQAQPSSGSHEVPDPFKLRMNTGIW